MLTPKVTEIAAVSAHRREVALVRWSLVAIPEAGRASGKLDPRDPLHRIEPGHRRALSSYDAAW
jgi:hypothetical protein